MRFSQRLGKTEVQTIIQSDVMTDGLYNLLFNIAKFEISRMSSMSSGYIKALYNDFCFKFAEKDVSYFRFDMSAFLYDKLDNAILNRDSYFMYDFIEMMVQNIFTKDELLYQFNQVLSIEKSAYRFGKDKKLIPITDDIEIDEIDKETELAEVDEHLQKAKQLFSDREKPEYKKSITESINAIETLLRFILEDEDVILSRALKEIEGLHPALTESINKLYAFTSDMSGLRHGNKPKLKEDSKEYVVGEDEARFILVTSHSIVNYLKSKYLI